MAQHQCAADDNDHSGGNDADAEQNGDGRLEALILLGGRRVFVQRLSHDFRAFP
jgi:hypothetical protein